MSSLNKTSPAAKMTVNSAGTAVNKITPEKMLRRMTLAHMLWENQAYIDGKSSSEILASVIALVDPKLVEATALEARTKYKMRHVPLFIMRELARHGKMQATALAEVIQRPDEIGEFISLYWKDKKQPLSNQVKKGLALAFQKFNEYQFAKWDKTSANVRLRDAMFLVHAKPDSPEKAALFAKIAEDKLEVPDTWETSLSAGADKKDTFIRLMAERKLGALAFIRNLRNMISSGVRESTIRDYAATLDTSRVLPFRFISAKAQVPSTLHGMLETLMLKCLDSHEKLPGHTVLVVDVSGSMGARLSGKSDLTRFDAAVALAVLAREICEKVTIYATAGSDGSRKHATVEVPNILRGFKLADYFRQVNSQIGSGGIFFVQVMDFVHSHLKGKKADRVLVFTDEQDTSRSGRNFNPATAARLAPEGRNYIINVGADQNGINSKEWFTITGMSEAVIDFIQEVETASW